MPAVWTTFYSAANSRRDSIAVLCDSLCGPSATSKHWCCAAAPVCVQLRAADGVLVPGGFGNRGVEGKILAAQYARENKVPYLGICLGMQVRQW